MPIKLAVVRRMWREVLQGKATDAARIFAYLVDRMESKPPKFVSQEIDLSGGAIVHKSLVITIDRGEREDNSDTSSPTAPPGVPVMNRLPCQ